MTITSNLTGQVALITGGASGIGAGVAKSFLKSGARVIVNFLHEQERAKVISLIKETNGIGEGYRADVSVEAEVNKMIDHVINSYGRLDILVNNAGMTQIGVDQPSRNFQDLTVDDWDYGIDINLKSTFLVTKGVLPLMKKIKFGRVINIASVTGPVVGINGSTVYSAAKAAILGLTRSLAIEEGNNGITVNCIGPGWIKTGSSSEEEIIAGKHTPIGRPGTPEEIGHTALFLASDESSYLTGQLIVVDGGNTIQEYKVELNV